MKQKIVSHIVRPTWSVKKVVKISYSSYLFSVAKLRFGKNQQGGHQLGKSAKLGGNGKNLASIFSDLKNLEKLRKLGNLKNLGKPGENRDFCNTVLIFYYSFNRFMYLTKLQQYRLSLSSVSPVLVH